MKELTIQYLPAQENAPAGVRVRYSPEPGATLHECAAGFTFEMNDDQRRDLQWYLEQYLIYPWGEWRNRARRVEELMAQLGVELFRAVFSDEGTRDLYGNVKNDLEHTRIVINADDSTGIALPWELLRDPTRGEYGDLARLAHAFVRSQPDLIFDPPAARSGDAFNILMVICRPGGSEEDVPFQSVARPLLEMFRPHQERIHLDVLRPPTFEQLGRVLNDKPNFYHVLHFDGHGTFPEFSDRSHFYGQAGEQGYLLFEGEDGKPNPVTGQALGGLLAGKGVPVVLLNACRSGMTRPESLYPSVGNQLLKAGTRGVVAMGYSVYVQTAARFMARLYEGLINGNELEHAAALARDDLRAHPQRTSPIGQVDLQDWMVPVLFQAAPVRLVGNAAPLHIDVGLLEDQQAKAGAEVDCPEPPAFGFVGRDSVMLELERALRDETIVLLQGMAGVGKTEMAMGFARWRAETGALDGPIFFFRFERYLPLAHVCDRIGQVFNDNIIRPQLKQDWHLLTPDQRREIALLILKQVPCLLIWDNFEPVAGFPAGTASAWKEEEQGELGEFLSALRGGKSKVLLTSRREETWLGSIYRCAELHGLALVEAQELAVRVLKRAGLNPEQIRALPQYNDLLRYLHGNPLAIQVILPELKRTSPDTLLANLQAGAVRLSADDPRQGRERSLSASLTYRLDALDTTLRHRLGLLALFQGFVDADVLASMCQQGEGAPDLIRGLGREEWVRMLDTAAQVGLLRRVGAGLYTVHPALPWFFHDLAAEAFSAQGTWLASAFATIYGDYAHYLSQLFETNAQGAMQLLGAEEANLRYALQLARGNAQWGAVSRVLYGLNRLLTTQGRWTEWERLVGDLEGAVTDAQGEPLAGREDLWVALLGHRSGIADYQRDFEREEAILLRLKEHDERVGDEKNQAVALHQLGRIAEARREFEEAERWYRQSLALEERIGNEHGQAITLHQLGIIAQKRREFEEAERWYRQSLAIEERIGAEYEQAGTLHQLGMIAEERRQFEEAERWYRQSLVIRERIGNEHGQARTLHQLGRIAEERREFEAAERWYRQSLAIKERIKDEHGQAITLHQLGNIAYLRREFAEAERWYRQSLALAERIGDEHGQASTLSQLGIVAQERRQFDEAEQWQRQSLAIRERIGDEYGQAICLHGLGRIAEEQGNTAEAVRLYEQAESLFARLSDPYSLSIVHNSLKRVRGESAG